jgi:hypothetical protein
MTIIPQVSITGQSDAVCGAPFATGAPLYRAAGWLAPIYLPPRGKKPPPAGYTGLSGQIADDDTLAELIDERPDSNIANWLGFTVEVNGEIWEIVGVDRDQYVSGTGDNAKVKRGDDQLKELQKQLNSFLPDTWISTAREDGVSGIGYYRVPPGLHWRDPKLNGRKCDIEIIWRGHMYAICWPSIHPDLGTVYRWYAPGAALDGVSYSDEIPDPATLPALPAVWADYLTAGQMKATHRPIDMDSTDAEIDAWVDEWLPDGECEPCTAVAETQDKWLKAITEDATSHDKIRDAHWEIVNQAAEGHTGWVTAINAVDSAWAEDVLKRDKRSRDELMAEAKSSRDGALRKVKAKVDQATSIGARYTPPRCTCKSQRKTKMDGMASKCMADIAPKPVRWLWRGWVPFCEISIFEGESDVGKSTVTISWAATVSRGLEWPMTVIDGKILTSQHDPAGALFVGIEDSNETTVVPRLIAAGADLSRCHSLDRPVDVDNKPKPFTIPDDIEWLRKGIREAEAKLVIIDPITACLPENTKHGVDSDIRRILMHLVNLAREEDCAIVMIRHWNKSSGMNAKNRGGGSVAYAALVRSVLTAAELPRKGDDGSPAFAVARAIGNLSKRPQTLTYRLESAPDLPELPAAEDESLGWSVVKWSGVSELTADELVGADDKNKEDARYAAPLREYAQDTLKHLLSNGPMKGNDVVAETMRIVDCSRGTVLNAAKKLEVIKRSIYVAGLIDHWEWSLPPAVISMSTGGPKKWVVKWGGGNGD